MNFCEFMIIMHGHVKIKYYLFWSACALIFSGRPAPSWPVSIANARALVSLWESLPLTARAPPRAPALGYGGCVLIDGAGTEWRAHDGLAILTSAAGVTVRGDDERRFERAILATAPDDALPRGIID